MSSCGTATRAVLLGVAVTGPILRRLHSLMKFAELGPIHYRGHS
jgi:hypothetical protein